MSSIESVTTASSSAVSLDRLENINNQLKDLPAVLDKQTLQDLRDGRYDITLEEYTDLNTYRTDRKSVV